MSGDGRGGLAAQGWLATTPEGFAQAVLAEGQLQALGAGDLFSRAGERGYGIWGVVSGQVSMTSAMNGADAPPGILFHPGHWGGYLPLFDLQRMANGRAVIDSTILTVPYTRVQALLAAEPGAWQHIARLVLMDSLRFATLAVDLMIRDSDRRLAAVLLGQAGCRQAGEGAEVHLSQAELGEMTKLSRHPVASILAGFAARGWVECGYRSIRVLDPDALRAFAHAG